ncbi:hypothetical protein M2150_001648 [Lachnospiraceae bacterium PM6-15]|uniref:hypothetical protein n=1 Tax=Ohessyouella blattaphilus TaxID=2949333 RepID=UPI003E254496
MREKIIVSVGEQVIVRKDGYVKSSTLDIVKNVTPKGSIRTEGGSLFDEYGALKGGDSWTRKSIVKYEGEAKRVFDEGIEKASYSAKIEKVNLRKLSLDQLQRIYQIIQE